jgi:DnaJ like chaperone protein
MSYGVFRVVKDLYSHFFDSTHNTDASSESSNQVKCPYCKTKHAISNDGLWTCATCHKGFEVQHGLVSTLNHVVPRELALVVELFAKFTKADGRVTKKEIRIVDQLLKQHFHPTEKQLFKIREIFNTAKATSDGYIALLHKLQSVLPRYTPIRLSLLHCLFQLAQVDGGPNEPQKQMIQEAAAAWKVTSVDYVKIRENYENDLDPHYRLLHSKKTDSLETIKKNYRQLIKEHHPDRYMNQNVSPDFIALMNQRIHDIHRAYKVITSDRKAN